MKDNTAMVILVGMFLLALCFCAPYADKQLDRLENNDSLSIYRRAYLECNTKLNPDKK